MTKQREETKPDRDQKLLMTKKHRHRSLFTEGRGPEQTEAEEQGTGR